MDTHLEVVVIPVSDVDRAKAFYSMLGWRLDADVSGDEYRLVQFTPPGSACSILSNQKESRGQVLFCIHNRWHQGCPTDRGRTLLPGLRRLVHCPHRGRGCFYGAPATIALRTERG